MRVTRSKGVQLPECEDQSEAVNVQKHGYRHFVNTKNKKFHLAQPVAVAKYCNLHTDL